MINLKPLTSTLAASIVVTVMGAFDVANAASFNFSFSNEDGPVNGTVEGTIELPDGDGVFAASSIIVDSAPAALGYTLPFDVIAEFTTQVLANSFTVVGGNIDASASGFAAFFSPDTIIGSSFGLANGDFTTGFNVQLSSSPFTGVIDADSSTLVFSSASVPEPTSMIALAGVGLLGVASKLKKKA